jgi:5-methyltetrahydrofolate--homocysteine methyltransferase
MSQIFSDIGNCLKRGDAPGVEKFVRAALDEGHSPLEIIKKGLVVPMEEIGVRFRDGEVFVPDVLVAARAMQAGMGILKPLLSEADKASSAGTVVIGTVQGDIHDIGKNLVAMLLEGAGFEVVDVGIDVKPEVFVAAAQEHGADIVAMSALLTTTMPSFKNVMDALEAAGIRSQVKVMVGGAPVTADYAKKVGADAYAEDGPTAVEIARDLVS